MRPAPALLFLTLVACSSSGDGSGSCTTVFKSGVRATLTDAATGRPIQGAVAMLEDGLFLEMMIEVTPGVYHGAYEREGTYDLTITVIGYLPHATNGIQVTHDGCHVRTQELSIALAVVPAGSRVFVLRLGDGGHTIDEAYLVHSDR